MPEKLILCSFMKDEIENVGRMLKAVSGGLYDYFCIGFDVTSSDGTEELVRETLKGQEGVFYYFRWRDDFSFARNLCLSIARDRYPDAAYSLMQDGDDVLDIRSRDFIRYWLENPDPNYWVINCFVYLDEDPWGIPYLLYPRATITINNPAIVFEGKSHNTIACSSERQLLVQQLIVHHRQRERKRAYREKQRVEMNIPNLMAQAEAEPDEARPLFYEANTRLDDGDFTGAEEGYLRYIARSTWPEERYQAKLHLSAIRFTAGDVAGARIHLWSAIAEPGAWNRAEGYMHLGDCALADGNLVEALHWYSIAGEIPPPISSLFLQGAVYTYLPHWRLALLFDRLGQLDQAYEHAKRAEAWRPSPDIVAGVKALEGALEEAMRAGSDPSAARRRPSTQALSSELSMRTQILPLPEADLERMLAEIPIAQVAD